MFAVGIRKGCFHMKKRSLTYFILGAFLLDACVMEDGTHVETDTWYTAENSGRTMFFNFSSFDGQVARGLYYDTDSGFMRSPDRVTVTLGKRRSVIVNDSTRRKIKVPGFRLAEYIEPEFTPADTSLYRIPRYSATVTDDIVYGTAQGYWTSLSGVETDVMKLLSQGIMNSFSKKDLELTMDISCPQGKEGKSPLIVFIHGGAFYVGDKQEPAYMDFKRHFAELGYVTACINYRMGFHIGRDAIERAGYMAAQDAHAAIRWLVHHASEYGIDRDRIFLAGSSAGSITAMNATFMSEKFRPESTRGKAGLFRESADLGRMDRSGNDLKDKFHITAIANMWGAVSDLDMLDESRTDIVSFHGDADQVVPYADGLPFMMAGEKVAGRLSEEMHGSLSITEKADELGRRAVMYPYPGMGHAFNTTGREKTPNSHHYEIRGRIADFFYSELVPVRASLHDDGDGWYSVDGIGISNVSWHADGGFVVECKADRVRILWRADSPLRTLSATGKQTYGTSFLISAEVSDSGHFF